MEDGLIMAMNTEVYVSDTVQAMAIETYLFQFASVCKGRPLKMWVSLAFMLIQDMGLAADSDNEGAN